MILTLLLSFAAPAQRMADSPPTFIASLFLAGALVVCAEAPADQVYRWLDNTGKVHFSDRPPVDNNAGDIEIRSYRGSPEISAVPAESIAAQVTMFTTTWCGYCKRARAYLNKMGIPFVEYDVEHDEFGKREYKKLNGRGVPVILVGDQRMNGFSAPSLEKLLRNAGLLK
jgi:glutaredoxin